MRDPPNPFLSGSHLCIPKNETVEPPNFQNRIIMFCLPIPSLICCICYSSLDNIENEDKKLKRT